MKWICVTPVKKRTFRPFSWYHHFYQNHIIVANTTSNSRFENNKHHFRRYIGCVLSIVEIFISFSSFTHWIDFIKALFDFLAFLHINSADVCLLFRCVLIVLSVISTDRLLCSHSIQFFLIHLIQLLLPGIDLFLASIWTSSQILTIPLFRIRNEKERPKTNEQELYREHVLSLCVHVETIALTTSIFIGYGRVKSNQTIDFTLYEKCEILQHNHRYSWKCSTLCTQNAKKTEIPIQCGCSVSQKVPSTVV